MRLLDEHDIIAVQVERVYQRRRIIIRPGKGTRRQEPQQRVVVEVEPELLPEPPDPPEYIGTAEETARAVRLLEMRRRLGLPRRAR